MFRIAGVLQVYIHSLKFLLYHTPPSFATSCRGIFLLFFRITGDFPEVPHLLLQVAQQHPGDHGIGGFGESQADLRLCPRFCLTKPGGAVLLNFLHFLGLGGLGVDFFRVVEGFHRLLQGLAADFVIVGAQGF